MVVAGTLERYHLDATLENLVEPSVFDQGMAIDTYLSLSLLSAAPFRSEMEYMNHLAWDPLVTSVNGTSQTLLRRWIEFQMTLSGAVPRYVEINTESPDWRNDPLLLEHRNRFPKLFSEDGMSLQFPILDHRKWLNESIYRANRNILTVFYTLKQLWEKVEATEALLGVRYDYVLFLRDDARFLVPLDWQRLLQQNGEADAYVLACDAKATAMHPLEINDYGGLYRRSAARIYGRYWDALFRDNLTERCAQQLDSEFRKKRGCNSEMLLRMILMDEYSLTIQRVGQSQLPFQRSVHVKMSDESVQPCFHKFCQSSERPLLSNGTLKQCLDLSWSSSDDEAEPSSSS